MFKARAYVFLALVCVCVSLPLFTTLTSCTIQFQRCLRCCVSGLMFACLRMFLHVWYVCLHVCGCCVVLSRVVFVSVFLLCLCCRSSWLASLTVLRVLFLTSIRFSYSILFLFVCIRLLTTVHCYTVYICLLSISLYGHMYHALCVVYVCAYPFYVLLFFVLMGSVFVWFVARGLSGSLWKLI